MLRNVIGCPGPPRYRNFRGLLYELLEAMGEYSQLNLLPGGADPPQTNRPNHVLEDPKPD